MESDTARVPAIVDAPQQPTPIVNLDDQTASINAEDADLPDVEDEIDSIDTDDSEIQALLKALTGKS